MKLLIIRHGECEANVLGIVAGARDDSLLTQNGIDEAEQTARRLLGFEGLIVSSPLRRAYHTAEIIRDRIAPGGDIRLDPDFIELDVGDAMGMPLKEYFALERSGATIKNAETPATIFARVKRGIARLKDADAATLLITHNGTYRMMVCVLQELPPHEFANVPKINNGEIKELDL